MQIVLFPQLFKVPQQTRLLGLSLQDRWTIPAQKRGIALGEQAIDGEDTFVLMLQPVILSQSGWEFLQELPLPEPEKTLVLVPEALVLVRTKNIQTLQNWRQLPTTAPANFATPANSAGSLNTAAPVNSAALANTTPPINTAGAANAAAKTSGKAFFPLTDLQQLKSAETWLLNSLVKDTEGFMSRHFERKISLGVTKRLIATPITPNQMTLFSIALGVVGAFFFIPGEKWYHVCGSLLFWLHSVLDGCDGEIARLKFLHSRLGAVLDFWGDNVVHSFIFAGIAVGYSAQNSYAWLPGLLAVGGTMGSAGIAYLNTMRAQESGSFQSVMGQTKDGAMQKILDALARRDFIYLVILLALFGKTHYFLWMSAVGAPGYFLVLLFLTLRLKKS